MITEPDRWQGCCDAPRCVQRPTLLMDGDRYLCFDCAELLVEWLCVEPVHRRKLPAPFETIFRGAGAEASVHPAPRAF